MFELVDFGFFSFMSYGGGSFIVDESFVLVDVVVVVKEKEVEILGGFFCVNVNDIELKFIM